MSLKQWVSLQGFYSRARGMCPGLGILAFILLGVGVWTGLFCAPADFQQGETFRIVYVHVPCAFLSLLIYTVIGLSSMLFYVWQIKLADVLAASSAPIGACFTGLALLTGAIWGKPMWGAYWVWDARLTAELILLFLYLGYIALRSSLPAHTAARASAILAMVGLVDVPIIHYSVQWWQTLHQGPTLSRLAKPSMAPEMLYPLLLMLAGFLVCYLYLLLRQSCHEILRREWQSRWVKQEFARHALE